MNYLSISLIACVLAATISAPVLSSAPQGHAEPGPGQRTPAGGIVNNNNEPVVPHRPAAVPAGPQAQKAVDEKLILTLKRPDLAPDMRRMILHKIIDNPAMSKEQVFAVVKGLGFADRNWDLIEHDYFNDRQITAFANQAVAPDMRGRFTTQDVINYFGLDTPNGKLYFLQNYGKGLPEATESRRFEGAFNTAFLRARDEINKLSEQGFWGSIAASVSKIALGEGSGAGVLDLHARGLILLPREIGKLGNIHELNLSNNRLYALPAEIGGLVGLKTLNVMNNRLTVLPPQIGRLVGLDSLELVENRLTALPPQIGDLKNLRFLFLQNNLLSELPPQMGKLSELLHLHLEGNRLTSLPNSLGNLPKLREIDLNRNRLSNLPATFYKGNQPKFKIVGMND